MKFIRTVLISLFLLMALSNVCLATANEIEFTAAEKEFIQKHPVIRLGVDPQFVPYEFFVKDAPAHYKIDQIVVCCLVLHDYTNI